MSHGSKRVIYAALIGNSLIAVTKFAAATITGSSAMFSEAIHSCVDTGNQMLLLFGLHRAKRKSDDKHPFGYSQEIYFWAFVVAILIFALGSGISIYEGVHKVRHPEPVTSAYVNYIVLGFAMIFEGVAWAIAFREFNSRRGKRSIMRALEDTKDPSVMTVLLEDTAAMMGLMVAFTGIFASQYLGIPVLDGVASIVIGIILAFAAVILGLETKSLLIGESASPETVHSLEALMHGVPGVSAVNEILTMHLGPEQILLNVSLDFEDHLTAGDVEETVTRLEKRIRSVHPEVTRIFIEIQSAEGHREMSGDEI
jgi:cation diffusion facilitator family transporter